MNINGLTIDNNGILMGKKSIIWWDTNRKLVMDNFIRNLVGKLAVNG